MADCSDHASPPSSDDDLPSRPSGARSSGKKFSAQQTATLTAYYNNGMKGVGEAHAHFICRAAKEAKLNESQVKVSESISLGI